MVNQKINLNEELSKYFNNKYDTSVCKNRSFKKGLEEEIDKDYVVYSVISTCKTSDCICSLVEIDKTNRETGEFETDYKVFRFEYDEMLDSVNRDVLNLKNYFNPELVGMDIFNNVVARGVDDLAKLESYLDEVAYEQNELGNRQQQDDDFVL